MLDLSRTFHWLSTSPEARDSAYASHVTTQLTKLWKSVEDDLGKEKFASTLGTLYAGRFSSTSTHAWVQTNAERDSDFVNLTLELDPGELSLNVVGWFDGQLQCVEQWLRTSAARRLLRELDGWEALIFIRTGHKSEGGRVVYQGAEGRLVERMPLSASSPVELSLRLSGLRPKLHDNEKLSLHLRRAWTADEVANADGLGASIAAEVDRWLDPLEEIRLA